MCMCMAQSIECIVRNMKLNISQNRAFFIIIITAGFNLLDMYSTHRLKRWGLCKFSRQQLQRPRLQVAGANLVDINVQVSKRLPGEKISQHQCRGCSLLGILLTTLSLEAVATASVNQSSAMLPNSPVLGLYFSMPSHMGKKKHYLKLSVCLLQFKALCSPPLSLTLHLLASQLQPEIKEILKKSKRLARITCLDTLSSFSCSLGQKSDKSLLVSEYQIKMSRKDVE